MSSATELFERGKSYFDNNKYDEALRVFSEAVRLEPSNADYHAWLARTLVVKEKYADALASANQALQLNPRCQLAYRQRGAVHRNNEDYQKAIQDYSQAIQLDPQDHIAFCGRGQTYYWALDNYENAIQDCSQAIQLNPQYHIAFWYRGKCYEALDDYENALMDIAQYYRLSSASDWERGEYSGQTSEFQVWYRTIHQHYTDNLRPRLKVGDERFVEYWPCHLEWGKETRQSITKGTSYEHIYGAYGTGYLCLTNINIHLVSIGQLSQQFPLYKSRGILASIALGALGRTFDHQKPEKGNKVWIVPHKSITGAHMAENHIALTSSTMTWEIYEHFTGDLRIILAGINLGATGRFAARETTSKSSETVQPANADVVDLLKQLGELRAQGIITDTEFEQKKKELLARL